MTTHPATASAITGRRQQVIDLLGCPVVTPVVLCIVVALFALLAGSANATMADATVIGLINLTLVISLYVFVGNSGIFSFGHSIFMLIGAYTAGLLVIPTVSKEALLKLPNWMSGLHLSPLPAALVAVVVALLVGALVAIPLTRMGALAAGLGTFAVLNIGYNLAVNWTDVTGGPSGLAAVPTTTTVSTALLVAIVAIVVAWLFQQTSLCLRLRATREDEVAARSVGIRVMPERAAALTLSAGLAAMAGAVYAQYVGSFTPDAFFLAITFTMVSMLVVGGRASLTGAVVGALVLSALTYELTKLQAGFSIGGLRVGTRPGLKEFGVALVTLACLIKRPRGLTGGRELSDFFARRGPRDLDAIALAVDVQAHETRMTPSTTPGPTTAPDSRMEVSDVSVQFGGLQALTYVSMSLARGEILGLIGPNGAGKTTLLNVLTGYQRPTAGEVRIEGTVVTDTTPETRARRGVIRSFQGARLFGRLTVAENVEVACVAQGASRRTARREAAELLRRFGLADLGDSLAETTTHGQQRLLGVVRALAGRPDYLLLDEPAAGLNETETDELAELLRRLPGEFGLGLLVVEHDMRLIFGLCDRVHVLAEGRTVVDARPEIVREHPDVVRSYLGSSYEHRS
jgi:branched-chain amino acid transport system permease protein